MASSFKSCSVSGCNGNSHYLASGAKGLCRRHYSRRYEQGPCKVAGCRNRAKSKRMCSKHLTRLSRHGKLDVQLRAANGERLVWLITNVGHAGETCLIWPYARFKNGYGSMRHDGVHTTAHRVMCILVNGPPPTPKHHARHTCGRGESGCVHPGHVKWGDAKRNSADKRVHGTVNRGTRNGGAKLTGAIVREIRKLAKTMQKSTIARKFKVSDSMVGKIVRREKWAWLS